MEEVSFLYKAGVYQADKPLANTDGVIPDDWLRFHFWES